MTRQLVHTSQFKRDFRKRIQSAKSEAALADVLRRLVSGDAFDARHRDHRLRGGLSGIRDCHVLPDLLLLYEIEGNTVILRRLGTHSDLFG
jgi:mRNA interferase YafQ